MSYTYMLGLIYIVLISSRIKMGLRRSGVTKDYEEMPGANVPTGLESVEADREHPLSQEFELSSVSVVPDGRFFSIYRIFCIDNTYLKSIPSIDTYTVTQAVNALGFGWFQVKLSLCVGLCWMADSMEMTILSVLGPALHCDWGITRYQQALTTTIVFLGMMLSSTFWGQLSDRYGRKPVGSFGTVFDVRFYLQRWAFTGIDLVWCTTISVWSTEFSCSKFWVAVVLERSRRVCYWMCSTVVSSTLH